MLSDLLMNSPVMAGEDGVPLGMGAGSSNFDPLMDPMAADDPELAMVSELLGNTEISVLKCWDTKEIKHVNLAFVPYYK